MTAEPIRVLFVCTGNSARSIMAEALLRREGADDFEVFSAGTEPRGVNPLTRRVLGEAGIEAASFRSKSVNDFLGGRFDYVITVCDQAREACLVFPGGRTTLHWSHEDPAAVDGPDDERMAAFVEVFHQLRERIAEFVVAARRERDAVHVRAN